MTDFEPQEDLPPVAHVTMVYNGPVAPHWQMRVRYGDQKMLDDFWTRVNARLLLLPKHDPQFRRNRERVNRDAERERIICDWDLGEDDAETTSTPAVHQEIPTPQAIVAPQEVPAPQEVEPIAAEDEDAVEPADPIAAEDEDATVEAPVESAEAQATDAEAQPETEQGVEQPAGQS